MQESKEASSGDAFSQSSSEHEKTEELHITLDPNFEASRIIDLPKATPSSTVTELTGESQNIQGNEFAWTVAGDHRA